MAVRQESVRISLIDDFSTKAAKVAAHAALINKNLTDIDGTSLGAARGLDETTRSTDGLGTSMRRQSAEINQFSGRLRLMAEAAATLGPALIPVGAVAAPAVAGLASALSVAAIAGGSAVVAFQGVGEAVKTLQEAKLDPTVANLEKAQEAMALLGPDARAFVLEFQAFRPVLTDIRDAAAAGWFPGLTESLTSFEALAPRVITLFEAVGKAGGDAVAAGAESLSGPAYEEFFAFLATEAPEVITKLSSIVGSLAHAATEMWMAFDPGNDAFLDWVGNVADGFDAWASSAGGRQDIESFLAYVRETGPDVADAFGSLVNMLVQITQAAAPLGGPVLKAVSAFADVVASIADSNLGTPIFTTLAAMTLLTRGTTLWGTASTTAAGKFVAGQVLAQNAAGKTSISMAGVARSAGALAIAYTALETGTGIVDSFNRSRDAADGTTKSFDEVRASLEKSNVGKYAEDFGINLDRLAEDIVKFGTEGTYYKTVLEEMASANDGFSGKAAQLGNFLTPFMGAAEKAGVATLDLKNIVDNLFEPGVVNRAASYMATLTGMAPVVSTAASATDDASRATGMFAGAAAWAASASRLEAKAINDSVKAMREKRSAALGAFDAETQYREALKAARAQADKTSAGIRGNSDAALENRRQLGGLAAAWNNQSVAVKNNEARFKAARSAFIETAQSMGVSERAAKQLANQILDIPKSRVVDIKAKTEQAEAALAATKAKIDALRDKTVTVTVRQQSGGEGPAYVSGADIRRASGGPVYGPGGPREDKVPAMLSAGEFVMQAAAVDRYGLGMMYDINSMRAPIGQSGLALAAGGVVACGATWDEMGVLA